MDNWAETLSFIAACGGAGAFVDFFIGKHGQKKVRGWLEACWILMSDVRIRTFARDEAEFAYRVLRRFFGTSFSASRLKAWALLILIATMIWAVVRAFAMFNGDQESNTPFASPILFTVLYSIISWWFAISVSIWLAQLLATKIRVSYLNAAFFTCAFLVQIGFLAYSYEIQMALIWTARGFNIQPTHSFPGHLGIYIDNMRWLSTIELRHVIAAFAVSSPGINGWLSYLISVLLYFPGVLRLSLLVIFVLSYLLRPAQKIILLLLQRIVESDKPVFTLVCGALGALAKTLQSLVG